MGIKEFYNSVFSDGSRICVVCKKGFMPTYDQVPGVACYECEKECKKQIGCFDKYEGIYVSGVLNTGMDGIQPSGVYFRHIEHGCSG